MSRTVGIAFVTAFAAFSLAAHAGEAEINAAQSTISSQIEAFKAGDNAKAFSYADPSIAMLFPNVEAFMTMVEGGYRPVQKPEQYSFGRTRELGGRQIVQEVIVTGPDGKDYMAVYQLLLQADGSWKISGVSLTAAPTSSI
jgi:hypothetical protein